MDYLFCTLLGYLIGSINPSYIIAKLRGFDIRDKGSKNAGASNAVILMGKLVGVFCALFDIAKTYLAVRLCETLFPDFAYSFAIAGVACALGHIFPFYMKFKGGKGLACLGGIILSFDWRVFIIFLTIEVVIALLCGYICVMPITASVAFTVLYAVMTRNVLGTVLLGLLSCVIFLKHLENLKRIRNGTEMRLSVLWNKNKEIERLQNNKEE